MYNNKSIHIRHINSTFKHLLSNEIILIDYVKLKKNFLDSLTKGLLRELVYNSSRGTRLKPLEIKEYNDGNHI